MSLQVSNGCGHFGKLGVSNRHRIDRGWGLTLGPVRGLLLIFLFQVKPAFLQRIHFLILRIGVTALVNVVKAMERKVIITIVNTSIIQFTIKHSSTDDAATTTTTTTDTPTVITTSGLVATGRICLQKITFAKFTAFH